MYSYIYNTRFIRPDLFFLSTNPSSGGGDTTIIRIHEFTMSVLYYYVGTVGNLVIPAARFQPSITATIYVWVPAGNSRSAQKEIGPRQ